MVDHPPAPTEPSDAAYAGDVRRLVARIDKPLVLVGMMGSGKSSIGRRLATRLHIPFHDADEAIETAAQSSIAEIFARDGEAYFRDGERRVIARLLGHGPCVLATGGGAFVQPDTRGDILARGIAIWLDASVATLVERTSRRDHRPLLRTGNPAATLERLCAERRDAYAMAHIHIASDAGPHKRTLDAILSALEDYLA